MSFAQLKEAFAVGKLPMEMADRFTLVPGFDPALRGMSAGVTEFTRLSYFQAALTGTQYDSWAVLTDDSYWEPDVNYAMLAESGVDGFIIRAYGPTSWVDGLYKPKPDKEYFRKFKLAKATGKAVGGYVVHNEWEMEDDPQSSGYAYRQIQQWKEVFYGEYIPHFIVLDAEIEYKIHVNNDGSQYKVIMPGPNLTGTVRWTLDSIIKEWGKTTFLYSRVTWLDQFGGSNMRVMMDNFNAGGNRAHLHLAFYPTAVVKLPGISQADEFKSVLPAYSGTMRNYLEYGNTAINTRIWQVGPIKHPAVPQGAIDFNLVPLTPEQFNALVGNTGTVPPGGDPGGGGDPALTKRVEALEADVKKIRDGLHAV